MAALPSLEALWVQFSDELVHLRGRSPVTATKYTTAMRLLRAYTDQPVTAIDAGVLAGFAGSLECSDATKTYYLDALASFFKWLHRRKHIVANPFEDIDRKRPSPPPPRALRWRDALMAIERCHGNFMSARDRTLLTFALYTGGRVSQLVALKLDDIDMEERRVTFRKHKGKHPYIVYISGAVAADLRDYLNWRTALFPDSEFLFPTRSGRQMRVRHAQAIPHRYKLQLKLHQLRHTFATQALRTTKDLRLVQELMGHVSVATTARYLTVWDDTKRRAADGLTGLDAPMIQGPKGESTTE